MTPEQRVALEAKVLAFFDHHRVAFVGLSTNAHDFSRAVAAEMKKRGLDVVPVHPHAEAVDGVPAWPRVSAIPDPPRASAFGIRSRKLPSSSPWSATTRGAYQRWWTSQASSARHQPERERGSTTRSRRVARIGEGQGGLRGDGQSRPPASIRRASPLQRYTQKHSP